MIDEYSAKYKLDSVEFKCLTLGTLPPTFHGEKVLILLFSSEASENISIRLMISLMYLIESVIGLHSKGTSTTIYEQDHNMLVCKRESGYHVCQIIVQQHGSIFLYSQCEVLLS